MRASYNGITSASQADEEGSTPFARSSFLAFQYGELWKFVGNEQNPRSGALGTGNQEFKNSLSPGLSCLLSDGIGLDVYTLRFVVIIRNVSIGKWAHHLPGTHLTRANPS